VDIHAYDTFRIGIMLGVDHSYNAALEDIISVIKNSIQ